MMPTLSFMTNSEKCNQKMHNFKLERAYLHHDNARVMATTSNTAQTCKDCISYDFPKNSKGEFLRDDDGNFLSNRPICLHDEVSSWAHYNFDPPPDFVCNRFKPKITQ